MNTDSKRTTWPIVAGMDARTPQMLQRLVDQELILITDDVTDSCLTDDRIP